VGRVIKVKGGGGDIDSARACQVERCGGRVIEVAYAILPLLSGDASSTTSSFIDVTGEK